MQAKLFNFINCLVADILSSNNVLSVLNILHNALTLYKRVIGSKQQCTPSQRLVIFVYFRNDKYESEYNIKH